MRNFKQIFIQTSVFIVDFALILLSFILSYCFRYWFDIPPNRFSPFKETFLVIGLIYILVFASRGVFRQRFNSHWQLIKKVSNGMMLGTLLAFAFMYTFRHKWQAFPTSIFCLAIPTGILLISTTNIIIYRLAKLLKTNIVIIGGDENEEVFINRSQVEIHRAENIEDILFYKDIDEVLICKNIHSDSQLNLLIFLLNKLRINVNFKPELYSELLLENMTQGNTLRFLATSLGRKSDLEECLIRSLDILGSLALLIAFAPLMLAVSIMVKLTSSGPIFYSQQRAGKNGKPFTLYKFRTMINDAEGLSDLTPATHDDMRITKTGRMLRKLRLDELPQILNILQGKMSLVGPRPENLYRVNLHKALRGLRLAIKPGLTGLAQIRSYYDIHPNHKIKYDYLYIQRRSLSLNVYILIKTIPIVFYKKGM